MPPQFANVEEIHAEVRGRVGFISLNRPKALNALSLPMIRALTHWLRLWRDDGHIQAVALRGMGKSGPFGVFCAGGDIRFFHQAVQAGNPELEDFFTEEYTLNHLIHSYPKPTMAFMDGIVMGGGMGLSQGATHRIVTERTQMAMPETQIGLFPDVAGGYFLSRCPGAAGEWLALTGESVTPQTAIQLKLADVQVPSDRLPALWAALGDLKSPATTEGAAFAAQIARLVDTFVIAACVMPAGIVDLFHPCFSERSVLDIVVALEADPSEAAQKAAAQLRQKSPLMLHVSLELIRRARQMSLADELRLERDLMRHTFNPLHLGLKPAQSEAVEGIRAQVIDKDRSPRWNPPRIEEVTPAMVLPFFESPWPDCAHPLRRLG